MKFYTYTRKAQFTDKVENWIGVKNKDKGVYIDIYNPISLGSDGKYSIMRGVCHTNAENVTELTKPCF